MILIGITGKKQAGKDTFADMLANHIIGRGFYVYIDSFAKPFKNGIRAMFGVDVDSMPNKEDIVFGTNTSARKLMQTLGSEWGRHMIDKDLWVNLMERKIIGSPRFDAFIVPDVRFKNEADMIRRHGGKIIRVHKNNVMIDTHESEQEGDQILSDYLIPNLWDVESLNNAALDVVNNLFNCD